ncbi:DISARM system helicase DrmA [Planomicrobium sp. Y74]|uniref:DISARM system helicase DrmA n=1 Tax=Planomicrobium sp. Y74 TaxID=2478977 RepID=UPI000EF54433|nr:DISARM system helicase DrmA [Planomicrobium sp. Y74]RLQ90215.1 DNA helicase [Planomicrobium sp. Y74]
MSREIYSEVRNIVVKELKRDLIGPDYLEEDILAEPPTQAYITGILYPLEAEVEEEEILGDIHPDNDINESNEDEEVEESTNVLKITQQKQSSCGIRFFINENVEKIYVRLKWGEYKKVPIIEERTGKNKNSWQRSVISHELELNMKTSAKKVELKTEKEEYLKNIYFVFNKRKVRNTPNFIVSLFLVNENVDKSNKKSIYQTSIEVMGTDNSTPFICENKARLKQDSFQEFLYRNKPVFAKGYGCAVEWEGVDGQYASKLRTAFIPSHEIESMSTELPVDSKKGEFNENAFSIRSMAKEENTEVIIEKLRELSQRYENWIKRLPMSEVEDKVSAQIAIENCLLSLKRIKAGIEVLKRDPKAYQAFKFMNEVMHTQISMKNYSKNNQNTTLEDELNKENFNWRPFQLAFILSNIEGIIDGKSSDRELVDLLWFPTGGGKTEAYLGIIAFLMAYRRLSNSDKSHYERDGGVTVILRYTLRLLTTQQRDRLMRLISAAEYIRNTTQNNLGKKEFSIGFWVGGKVTANKFMDLKESTYKLGYQIEQEYEKIRKQVIECPCCGTKNPLYKFLPNEGYNTEKIGVRITCGNEACFYYKNHMPIYLIDEEIYKKTPTIIISTVDKFARIAWDEQTGSIFGKVDRYCERCGFIAVGEEHSKSHRNPAASVNDVKPFYPPELIIQDELHLITGPLGTIYGLYETAVEELSTAYEDGFKAKPKYIAATATIKNAEEQVRKVFGRESVSQFPPPGLSIEDSFFGREVGVEQFPFRLYTGICVSGHSMKTVLLRVYAVLLQVTETLNTSPEYSKYKDFIDPYRTLIGYFNSVRELGGTVRLLDDDITKRIQFLKKRYGYTKTRYLDRTEELTSRIPSYRIPKVLELLENKMGNKEIDVALATNMISVGMDVDRLGLMVVTGQPKQTAEYIQASSRVGRSKPGLVVTVYNPYRARDLSHYENFKGYHSRLYNFVEGTTATPYAARARDRALHALAVSIIRLTNPETAKNDSASAINSISTSKLYEVVEKRVAISDAKNKKDSISDLKKFIDKWRQLSTDFPELIYYKYPKRNNLSGKYRLLSRYNDITPKNNNEYDTLDSMRQIENVSKIFIHEGWEKK